MKVNPKMRYLVYLFSTIYLVSLITLGFLSYRASPGPSSQAILGVSLGRYDSEVGLVYLSGQRLTCTQNEAAPSLTSDCTIEIAGKTLTIHAQRNPANSFNQLGGKCDVSYDEKEWPCRIESRHVHVHWFAHISQPLGLSNIQLEALRREYFFENLPEDSFVAAIPTVSVLTMTIITSVMALWLWSRTQNKVSLALITTMVGMVSLVSTFISAVWLTNGFWD